MILHVDFFVTSLRDSLEFYCSKMQFPVVEEAILDGDVAAWLTGSKATVRVALVRVSHIGPMIELVEHASNGGMRLGWITILVANLDSLVARLERYGLQPCSRAFLVQLPKLGSSRIVAYQDPDGNVLEFVESLQGRAIERN